MQIFARITKVNEATGKVYGRAVQEMPDRSGEIFDYETSKPNFVKWSTDMAKATDGKSLGNVRAMHGKVAAGKLSELTFVDAEKAIDVCAEIVDPAEREKCIKGVYTGFSIGGRYAKKWTDEANKSLTRYTADPVELSLVDLPCIPTAQFTVVKADGSEELRKFETTTASDSLEKWADGLSDADAEVLLEKIKRRKNVDPKEGEHKYGDVEYADPTNKKYPIDTASHIKAAWNYIHMPRNAAKYSPEDVATMKRKIIAAWKAKVDPKGPPEAQKFAQFAERLAKSAEGAEYANLACIVIGAEPMEKGLWAVSQFAGLLEQLAALADGTVYEATAEGDGSKLPEVMRAALKPIAAAFLQMAQEETSEALHGELNDDAALAMAAVAGDLAKVGRKHTRRMREHRKMIGEHLDKAKEHLAALGADDPTDKDADDGKDAEKLAKAASDLAKIAAERDELKKQLTEIDALAADLKKALEAQPMPPKGSVTAVEKTMGLGTAIPESDTGTESVLKADGSIDHAATALHLMKAVYGKRRTA